MAITLEAPLRDFQSPRFSVVITCYNQAGFIGDAIESALTQVSLGSVPYEVIVVDDGSRDGSDAVIRRYDKSVRAIIDGKNVGAIGARNRGAQCARGEYLVFLDGDDVLMPEALSIYACLVAKRHPKIIVGRWVWFEGAVPSVDGISTATRIEFVSYECLIQKDRPFGLSASTFVVERQAFEKAGNWSEGSFPLDVVDLATKLGCCGETILILSPPTVFYRLHAGNTIHNVRRFLQLTHDVVQKEIAGDYPGARKYRFERQAWLGGVVAYWACKGVRVGLYREALAAVRSARGMIGAAVLRRMIGFISGRCCVGVLELSHIEVPATRSSRGGLYG